MSEMSDEIARLAAEISKHIVEHEGYDGIIVWTIETQFLGETPDGHLLWETAAEVLAKRLIEAGWKHE